MKPNKTTFIGRKEQLKTLQKLKSKKTASLVCILGRRRIGKSHLIAQFGKEFRKFVRIQGLGPEVKSDKQDQLNHFAIRISEIFNKKKSYYEDWAEAFTDLSKYTSKGEVLILLDEISWMGRGDPMFAAKLKDAWDTQFKENPKLILVACGSVSSWIEDNILNNASFEGRISLKIDLQELDFNEISEFWHEQNLNYGSLEKMQLLSLTGGVPKYLEEIDVEQTIEQNIIRLCFNESGFLYNEFKHIFLNIFERKSKTYEKIIRYCLDQKLSPVELAKKMKMVQNSDLSENIHNLELSGFLGRDFYFKPDGEVSKLSQLRVKDNYLRFYLKYIEPLRAKIEKGGKPVRSLTDIKNFESLMGFQFENLILKNREKIYPALDLQAQQIVSAAPYKQNKTTVNKGACQIDLLIHTNLDTFFLCELKCRKRIDNTVVKEVQKKIKVLKLPRRSALKPVLIYEGEIMPSYEEELQNYFFKIIHWTELLGNSHESR